MEAWRESNAEHVGNPESMADSLTAGVQNAFIFAMVVASVGLFLAFFIKRVEVER